MKYSANVLGYVVLAMTAAWAGASPCLAEESNDLCVNATAVGEGTFTGDSRDARTDGGVRAPCGSFAFDVSAQISVSAATSGPIADNAGVFNKNRKISADGVAKSHSITILQPSADMGTLRYHPGETIAIRWKSTGAIANVRIDLLYDPSAGGNPAMASAVDRVIAATTPNDGKYDWTIPSDQHLNSDYYIRISIADEISQYAHSLWWKYTPSAVGVATIDTCGSSFDATLALLTSCSGEQLSCGENPISCGGTARSSLQYNVIPERSYLIRVSSLSGQEGGDAVLNIALTPNDCNRNGIPDNQDIATGTSPDCNANSVPDECDLVSDCNANRVPDECDIAGGASLDCNDNGIPDECGLPADCPLSDHPFPPCGLLDWDPVLTLDMAMDPGFKLYEQNMTPMGSWDPANRCYRVRSGKVSQQLYVQLPMPVQDFECRITFSVVQKGYLILFGIASDIAGVAKVAGQEFYHNLYGGFDWHFDYPVARDRWSVLWNPYHTNNIQAFPIPTTFVAVVRRFTNGPRAILNWELFDATGAIRLDSDTLQIAGFTDPMNYIFINTGRANEKEGLIDFLAIQVKAIHTPDQDADGLPDWWETCQFGSATGANAGDDSDGDGLTTLEEYKDCGSDPSKPPYYVSVSEGNDTYDGLSASPQGGNVGPKQTLQAAINAANNGDTIIVLPGTYTGDGNVNLDFGDSLADARPGKELVIRSSGGADATILDCGDTGRLIRYLDYQQANYSGLIRLFGVIQGVTIRHSGADLGEALRSNGYDLTLKDCMLIGNNASSRAGAIYLDHIFTTFDNLVLGPGNSTSPGQAGAGIIRHDTINLAGNLNVLDGRIDVLSCDFKGRGGIHLDTGATLRVTGDAANDPPTIIHGNISGTGIIEVLSGQQLTLAGESSIDLGNPGKVTIEGKLVVQDNAHIQNTGIEVRQAVITTAAPVQFNNVSLVDSISSGGELFVQDNAWIRDNTITSEGDRYMDLDPDPTKTQRPTIQRNRIHVLIRTDAIADVGTLLELRAKDHDCGTPTNPLCASGAFYVENSPGFTEDPSANWVLESLEIKTAAKLNLTNRPGFKFQIDTSYPETVYVKTLKLHPDAVLNTGMQSLYYQNLVDQNGASLARDPSDLSAPMSNGSKIVDVPLLGFSLGIIAMNDDTPSPSNEFDIRVRKRLWDPSDIQPCTCVICPHSPRGINLSTCFEGAIERIPNARGPGNGVMEMQTRASNRQPAGSVTAKGSFARVGDEDIVIAFDYQFQENPDAEIVVSISDQPGVGERSFEVARLRCPDVSRAGAIGSGEFGVFNIRLPRVKPGVYNLNFTRGTYVELALVASRDGQGNSVPSRVWIDNWDPRIYCGYGCGDYDDPLPYHSGVTASDYLLLVAEVNQALADQNKWCLDLNNDGFIDPTDMLLWYAYFKGVLDICPTKPERSRRAGTAATAEARSCTGSFNGLLLAGKLRTPIPVEEKFALADALMNFDSGGSCVGANSLPPSGGEASVANGRLVVDRDGQVYQVHGESGLVRLNDLNASNDDQTIVAPAIKDHPADSLALVLIGIVPGQDDSRPLMDAAFHPNDSNTIYVVPVVVKPQGGDPYEAAAKLQLTGDGDYNLITVYGTLDEPRSDVRKTHLREIEIDRDGNYVFVISSYAARNGSGVLMDNDWMLIYDAQAEGCPASTVLFDLAPYLHSPTALTATRSGVNQCLYLAAGINTLSDTRTRVFRFMQNGSALTFGGMVDIANPVDASSRPPDAPDLGFAAAITAMAEDSNTGDLWVTGFTAPRFAADYPANKPPFGDDHTPLFTTPTLAKIPSSMTWSTVEPVTLIQIQAQTDPIQCHELALPLSAIYIPGPSAPPEIIRAVSRRTHGSAGSFDVNVQSPDAVECRKDGPTQILVTFDQPIRQTSRTVNDVSVSSGVVNTLVIIGNQLTITMSGATDAALLTIGFPGISNTAGQVATGTVCFGVLLDDSTGDKKTNVLDLLAIKSNVNLPITTNNFRMDVNADGNINVLDLLAAKTNLNKAITGSCP